MQPMSSNHFKSLRYINVGREFHEMTIVLRNSDRIFGIFFSVFPIFLFGCAFEFQVNSQRTTLEKQVLGSYQELEDDFILSSTVRGQSQKSQGNLSESRRKAIFAKMNQDFNRDDLEELKDKAILGEAADGTVQLMPKHFYGANVSHKDIDLAQKISKEENDNRSDIWLEIIASNPNLRSLDLDKVRKSYARMQRDRSMPGHYIQNIDGTWSRHKGA